MQLNLLPMPYLLARDILQWCCEHDVDKDKCGRVIMAMTTKGFELPSEEWFLEIPEKYTTWFTLKWGFDVSSQDTVES